MLRSKRVRMTSEISLHISYAVSVVAAEKAMLARQMGRNSERIERRAMCAVRKWRCRREGNNSGEGGCV